MESRREFLRNAALLTGGAFVKGTIPEAIARALAIDPEKGTTYLDAEHVVILMQENRSFDHCYGALQGVRGFRDPRAHVLPNGNRVWFQTDREGKTYAPFRLDIKKTNATWIGGLPHSWTDQVDARGGGWYDKWLVAKPRKDLPFTLGHYTREDIPFYYAFADAFTVCDQHFCSSLTGTTPNRLYLWTGTIREDAKSFARVNNEDAYYDTMPSWTTFPERLEDAGVSWRIYQNELYVGSGLTGEEDAWLGNFGDNPIEYFAQYNIYFAKTRREYVAREIRDLPARIAAKEEAAKEPGLTKEAADKLAKEAEGLRRDLTDLKAEADKYSDAAWAALSPRERALHEKAFALNDGDPDFRSLETLTYEEGGERREVSVPKGDLLHRFRKDIREGTLPTVSWIVAPQNFSDHPSSAWFGAWYVSECLKALTDDPEVWKKTIFILDYDENDGYFDHVPPFVAPFPGKPETGRCSEGLDTSPDVVTLAQEKAHGKSEGRSRESSIGLGYRVPMVVASPWSRGGVVNSQVFDLTSPIRFLEVWLAHKGKTVRETNVTDWRRTVSGDMTSIFRPYRGEKIELPKPLDRDATIEAIHAAKFRSAPPKGQALDAAQIAKVEIGRLQERGTRPSCPLPYELYADAVASPQGLQVTMRAGSTVFGPGSQGAPFTAYLYAPEPTVRSYAVRAGTSVVDTLPATDRYEARIDGPNGFMRRFQGGTDSPALDLRLEYAGGARPTGDPMLRLGNAEPNDVRVDIVDESYGGKPIPVMVRAGKETIVKIPARESGGWYDFTVRSGSLEYRYAGRVETGRWSTTDPAMA